MIRLGICAAPDFIDVVEKIGYEYLECDLTPIAGLCEEDFQKICGKVDASRVRVEAFNGMMPGELRVTGNDVDWELVRQHVEKAFSRAKRLGAQVIVFGSGDARRLPEGFDVGEGWRQLIRFLKMSGSIAASLGLVIAIEPLNRRECNIINTVPEAALLSVAVDMESVKVLGDTFHMAACAEPWSVLTVNGALLRHIHTAHTTTRFAPFEGDGEDYEAIMGALKAGGYKGRISIESINELSEQVARAAYERLDRARRLVWKA